MNRRNAARAATLATALVACAALATPGARAEEVTARAALVTAPASELWMDGTSTVHDWECRTKTVNVTFTRLGSQADPAAASAIEALIRSGGVRGVDVQIPVATLHSERKGLDKNMLKSLQAERYPVIRFRMERYTAAAPATSDTVQLRVDGTLTIAGTEKHVQLVAAAWKGEAGEWIEGSTPLDMSAFGITPPTMMLGALKVRDRVVIHYRLLLAPDTATVPAPRPAER